MNEQENIKNFIENFFKNLKSNVSWKNNILTIDKVSPDFEKLYRKCPYFFAFDELSYEKNKGSELITKGSTLPKIIASYLENKAETTLLKINFNIDIKNEIKNMVDFKEYPIQKILEEIKYDYIYRFIFLTTFQYINEKEQLITQIYTKDNKILEDFNIEDYPKIEGKKQDLKKESEISNEIKSGYKISKEKLRIMTSTKIEEISKELNESLEMGVKRVNTHYNHQIQELDTEKNKNLDNLKILNQKLMNANEKNKPIIEEKINRISYMLKNSKAEEEIQRLAKEKEFFINDEKHKHSLNVVNSLINTTVIYYPIYNFKVCIKPKNILAKELIFTYNPFTEMLSQIFCDSCKKEIKEINICSESHLSCMNCMAKCPRCANKICRSCENIICNVCGGIICRKCSTICTRCLKPACNSDLYKDITGKFICKNCAEYCTLCKRFINKNYYKQCAICKKSFCKNCMKERYVGTDLKLVCKTCEPKVKSKNEFRLDI